MSETADTVVVSYPADLSEWGRFQVEKPSFRAFLRRTRDEAAEGDAWEEFVGVGCCGDTLDVPLRVESVEGGDRVAGSATRPSSSSTSGRPATCRADGASRARTVRRPKGRSPPPEAEPYV